MRHRKERIAHEYEHDAHRGRDHLAQRGLDHAQTKRPDPRIRSLATALTDMTLTGFRSEALEQAFATIAAADAIVTVAPVYKADRKSVV